MSTYFNVKTSLQRENLLILDLELALMDIEDWPVNRIEYQRSKRGFMKVLVDYEKYLRNLRTSSGRGTYNSLYNAFTRIKEKKGDINKTNIDPSIKNQ